MSTSGSFTSDQDAAERRRLRAELARERVASGTATATLPTRRTGASTTRPSAGAGGSVNGSGRTAPAPTSKVDPALAPGTAYGVWRSARHFLVQDSLPDAVGTDVDRVVRWSGSIMEFRLRPRIVARLDGAGAWHPVAYAKDGTRQSITHAQADALTRGRLEGAPPAAGQQPPAETDHPQVTLSL